MTVVVTVFLLIQVVTNRLLPRIDHDRSSSDWSPTVCPSAVIKDECRPEKPPPRGPTEVPGALPLSGSIATSFVLQALPRAAASLGGREPALQGAPFGAYLYSI